MKIKFNFQTDPVFWQRLYIYLIMREVRLVAKLDRKMAREESSEPVMQVNRGPNLHTVLKDF